jgi:hypothetical protein
MPAEGRLWGKINLIRETYGIQQKFTKYGHKTEKDSVAIG